MKNSEKIHNDTVSTKKITNESDEYVKHRLTKLKKLNQPQHLPVLGILPYSLAATYGSCLMGP